MQSLLYLKDPHSYDYESSISQFLSQLPRETSTIDVLITTEIDNSSHLNVVLSRLYTTIRSRSKQLGWDYTLQVNVLFNKEIDVIKVGDYQSVFASKDIREAKGAKVLDSEIEGLSNKSVGDDLPSYAPGSFDVAAVGGTFDHLHDGHKILLSMTAFLGSKKLILGITGPELLVNKKYAEVLESYEEREERVKAFLKRVAHDPNALEIDFYEMHDVCGPTGFVKEIDALVVSAETAKGGEFVNNFRKEKGFPTLKVISIEVIGENSGFTASDGKFDGKLSSTEIREREYNKKHK